MEGLTVSRCNEIPASIEFFHCTRYSTYGTAEKELGDWAVTCKMMLRSVTR